MKEEVGKTLKGVKWRRERKAEKEGGEEEESGDEKGRSGLANGGRGGQGGPQENLRCPKVVLTKVLGKKGGGERGGLAGAEPQRVCDLITAHNCPPHNTHIAPHLQTPHLPTQREAAPPSKLLQLEWCSLKIPPPSFLSLFFLKQ